MKKEEILEKSREENKNQDVFEKEVMRDAGNIGAVVAVILATIFFVIQILLGEGMNYGLYAIVFSVTATGFIFKSIRMKRKHEIVVAVIYTIAVLGFSAAHICNLFAASTIL
ncbi:MAG: DUF6442 family protein [Anaerolineaceae bacterium]